MQAVFLRSIILYTFVVIAMRVMGKRQLGELSASEFVVTIMISELAAIPIQDMGIPILHGIIPIVVLVGLEFLFTFGTLKFIHFRGLLCGKPSIVVQEGRIVQKELHKNRMSVDELIEELRLKDVVDFTTLRYAILEPGGQISVVKYAAEAPPTAKEMGKNPSDMGLPVTLVCDGRYMTENINIRKLDKSWIDSWLRKNGKPLAKDIFLMTIDDAGGVFVSEKQPKGGKSA